MKSNSPETPRPTVGEAVAARSPGDGGKNDRPMAGLVARLQAEIDERAEDARRSRADGEADGRRYATRAGLDDLRRLADAVGRSGRFSPVPGTGRNSPGHQLYRLLFGRLPPPDDGSPDAETVEYHWQVTLGHECGAEMMDDPAYAEGWVAGVLAVWKEVEPHLQYPAA